MENILKILKDFGVELSEDKQKDFEKRVLENYKTISEVEKLQSKLTDAESREKSLKEQYDTDITKRDTDLKDLQEKLKAGEGNEATLKSLQEQLATLQTTYDTEKTQYQEKLKQQEYDFLVRESANNLKFSSNGAKKQFMQDVKEAGLAVKDGTLLGFSEYVDKYKELDAGAFLADAPAEKPPMFTAGARQPADNKEPEPFEMPRIL